MEKSHLPSRNTCLGLLHKQEIHFSCIKPLLWLNGSPRKPVQGMNLQFNKGKSAWSRKPQGTIEGGWDHSKFLKPWGEKGTLLHCLWECKLVQLLWRTVWTFLKKLEIELSYDPAIPLLGIYPDKIIIIKDIFIPMFIAALFITART